MGTATRAGLYLRISDDRRDGEGVERQEKQCRQLAKSLGWQVVAVYTDNDRSAYKKDVKRDAYDAMLDAIKSGAITAVIAWHSDRLHRQTRQFENYIDLCDQHGVQNQAVYTGKIDLSTATGKMNARMGCVIANFESDHRSERVRSAKRDLAEKGAYQGGMRPYGYDKHGMKIVKAEATQIRRLAKAAIEEQSLRSLTRELNDRGITNSRGAPWTVNKLRAVLSSPRIAGLREYHGQVIGKARWPAIIDMKTYEALKVLFDDRRRPPAQNNSKGGRTPRYLGSQLYVCGGCNQPQIVHTGNNQRASYTCRASRDKGERGHVTGAAVPIDAYVTDVLLELLSRENFVDEMCRVVVDSGDADLAGLAAERVKLQQLRKAWRTKAANGMLDPDEYEEIITGLTARDSEIAVVLEQHTQRSPLEVLRESDKPAAAVWQQLTLGQQRAVLAAVLTVTILRTDDVGRGSVRGFNTDRVDIRLTDQASAVERRLSELAGHGELTATAAALMPGR